VITIPAEEEGALEEMLVQLVEKYEPLWPDTFAGVGERMWLYRAVHFAVYSALTANLVPAEEGA
jgi:hypothetical protein